MLREFGVPFLFVLKRNITVVSVSFKQSDYLRKRNFSLSDVGQPVFVVRQAEMVLKMNVANIRFYVFVERLKIIAVVSVAVRNVPYKSEVRICTYSLNDRTYVFDSADVSVRFEENLYPCPADVGTKLADAARYKLRRFFARLFVTIGKGVAENAYVRYSESAADFDCCFAIVNAFSRVFGRVKRGTCVKADYKNSVRFEQLFCVFFVFGKETRDLAVVHYSAYAAYFYRSYADLFIFGNYLFKPQIGAAER